MRRLFAAVHESVIGTKATNRHVRSNVRFRGQDRTRYARFEFFAF
jgi:hypothetical protein